MISSVHCIVGQECQRVHEFRTYSSEHVSTWKIFENMSVGFFTSVCFCVCACCVYCSVLPDRGPVSEKSTWHWEARTLWAATGCRPHPGETPPQFDLPPSASSEPEATSPPPCSPTHTDQAWSERIILIDYIDIPIDSELGCLSSTTDSTQQRQPYIIKAELVDGNCEDVAKAAQGLSPQQLHKCSHFLWQASCVQPLLLQQLPVKHIKQTINCPATVTSTASDVIITQSQNIKCVQNICLSCILLQDPPLSHTL